jgi:hypothetical protein
VPQQLLAVTGAKGQQYEAFDTPPGAYLNDSSAKKADVADHQRPLAKVSAGWGASTASLLSTSDIACFLEPAELPGEVMHKACG